MVLTLRFAAPPSFSASLSQDETLVQVLRQRSASYLRTPVDHFEPMQCIAYDPRQEFQPHYDAFGEHNQDEITTNGQRVATMLLYLNSDFVGGETFFPTLGMRVVPRRGRAVMFRNVDGQGQIDPDMLHAGLPVFTGTKYVATLWLREKPFTELG